MATHFAPKESMDLVHPSNVHYHYPTQANKAFKTLMKVPPVNGGVFRSDQAGAPIRITLPAQGYLNPARSHLAFDVGIVCPSTNVYRNIRFQNNIQSIFRRVRLVYGSLPLEDIKESNVLVRMLTEATGTNTLATSDQTSITEGIGGFDIGNYGAGNNNTYGVAKTETRLWKIQNGVPDGMLDQPSGITHAVANRAISTPIGGPTNYRRYCVQLPLGLLQQPKYIPLKYLASQLTIELELASVIECMAAEHTVPGDTLPGWSYEIRNMTFNAELHEMDASYDAVMEAGLASKGGVPISFASWNTYIHSPSGSTTMNLQLAERNRSIKSIFNVLLPNPHLTSLAWNRAGTAAANFAYPFDSHAMCGSLGDASASAQAETTGWQKSYQFRLGGKQYPAQAVDNGQAAPNGGAESYCEFQKALNIVGDYSLSTAIDSDRWMTLDSNDSTRGSQCLDFHRSTMSANSAFNTRPPSCYVSAMNFETSHGAEISGVNGEEQNDIAFNAEYSVAQPTNGGRSVSFVYYDALLILRAEGTVELVK